MTSSSKVTRDDNRFYDPNISNNSLFTILNLAQKFRKNMPVTEIQKQILGNLWFNREYNKKSFIHIMNFLNKKMYETNLYIQHLESKVQSLQKEQIFKDHESLIKHFRILNEQKQRLQTDLETMNIFSNTRFLCYFDHFFQTILKKQIEYKLPNDVSNRIFTHANQKNLEDWIEIQNYFQINYAPEGCTFKYKRVYDKIKGKIH